MVSKPKAKAQASSRKPKVENNKRRRSTRARDAELFRAVSSEQKSFEGGYEAYRREILERKYESIQ